MPAQKYMNKSEFARHCGVTPASVARGLAAGRIYLSRNGLVDANHATNCAYKATQDARKSKTAKGRSESQPYAERNPDNRQNLKNLDIGSRADASQSEKESPQKYANFGSLEDKSEIDYAIEKMRSTTAINKARLAEMVRATIRRDFVDEVISVIGTCISDHFITMGDRLASDLAALADSTDPTLVRQIKEAVDTDVTSSLQELKLVIRMRYKERLDS